MKPSTRFSGRLTLTLTVGSLLALSMPGITYASHARPLSATPTTISLAPAHKLAGAAGPNCPGTVITHGPPIAVPSCNPPREESDLLTMKAPDRPAPFNGPANGKAYFQLKVFCTDSTAVPCLTNPGDQLDDQFTLVFTGITCKVANPGGCSGAGAGYSGSVGLSATAIRITDHYNNTIPNPPGADCSDTISCPATVTDYPAFFNSTCVGGNCSVTTSADAAIGPGAVLEGKRANWEFVGLGASQQAFEVYEEGLDGNFNAAADNKVFLRPGLFNP